MKIIIATDASACANAAIQSAMKMNYGADDELKVVTVINLYEPLLVVHQAKEMERARHHVEEVTKEFEFRFPDATITNEVLVGYPDQEIINTALEFKADLIVMGSHGRTGLSRFLWGSVSRTVMLDSPCAVRIVRENGTTQPNEKRVLIALEVSNQAYDTAHIMQHVLSASWAPGTVFKFISVLDEDYKYMFFDPMLAANLAAQKDEATATILLALKSREEQMKLAFGENSTSVEVVEGDPRCKILEEASDWHASVIVMGTHGRRGIEDVLLGSVADAVASHAPCSVEIVRHQARRPKPMHVIV